jgi:hypothetical protein
MVVVVPVVAAPCVIGLGLIGTDTLGVPLFALFVACMVFGKARRLYAVMFALALAMELYGTWCGNWVWAVHVPWIGLTTINPPLAAGAFYCVLDLLVMATVRACRTCLPLPSTSAGYPERLHGNLARGSVTGA